MDGGAWWAAVHGVAKSRTWLSDFTFTFHFHALENKMATHSSVLAWRIPGTGGAWWADIYGVAQSRTQLKRLSSSSSRLETHEEVDASVLWHGIFFSWNLQLFLIRPSTDWRRTADIIKGTILHSESTVFVITQPHVHAINKQLSQQCLDNCFIKSLDILV